MSLSSKHKKLLRKIRKHKIVRTTKDNADFDYLAEEGYIEFVTCDKPGDYYVEPTLTEKGEALLYERKIKFIETWLPFVVSTGIALAALIISIIALLKEPTTP